MSLPDSRESGERMRIRSLSKGLHVLSLFSIERQELTLRDIIKETGFPRPTAYRLARTLEDERYLAFNGETSRYHLGPAMIPALYLIKDHSHLVRLLHDGLLELAEEAGEHASLAMEVDQAAVVIDAASSSQNPFRPNLLVGRVQEGLSTAHSKVFAASKGKDELTALLALPRTAWTEHTITDPAMLAAEIADVAHEGVAFDVEEYRLGLCAVAAPVMDKTGAVVASVSIEVSVERFGEARRRLLAEMTKAFAERMSSELGYSSGSPITSK